MISFWLQKRHYQGFRQFTVWAAIVFSTIAQGQVNLVGHVNRRPASYIPDDDVIVKPIDNQLSFYQKYVASDKSDEVIQSRNQLKVWNDNQNFADEWGMDSTLAGSSFFVPTSEQKFQYFQDRYMRYLRRKGEDPIKNMPNNWYQDYRASNEIDTIDEMESRFKSKNKSASSTKDVVSGFETKEISVWKKTRFIFQPRLEQGLVVVGIKGPIAHARAWVGVNGQAEFNVQKSVDSIGFRLMFNYYAHTGRYFTSVDQRIMENVHLRVTSQKDPQTLVKDDTAMLLYAKQF
jgi:hypothetical protein